MIPTLRRWQTDALDNWIHSQRGIAKVVTGAGKTVFGLACYEHARRANPGLQLLIVVPGVPLQDQWTTESCELLDLAPTEIAAHGGGQRGGRGSPVHVAVINTARQLSSELTRSGDWMLIVDECHRAGSYENRRALNGEFVATLGLSATPERQYDEFFEEVIEPALGPVIYEYSYADGLRDGVLSPFRLLNYGIPLSDEEIDQISRTETAIAIKFSEGYDITDEALKRLFMRRARISQQAQARIPAVVNLAEQFQGRRGLIFHESIDAANKIVAALKTRDHRVAPYHSRLGTVARLRNLRMFRTGQLDLLVTCRALDEGLDVPDAEIGIIAASTSSIRQRIQRMGRVLRPSSRKDEAKVLTLYALDSERQRLETEIENLEGLAEACWFKVTFQ